MQEKQGNDVLKKTDSLEAIEAIQIPESTPLKSMIIKRIHHLLKNIETWAIEYIPRENKVEAYRMAKIMFKRGERLHLFIDNPFIIA